MTIDLDDLLKECYELLRMFESRIKITKNPIQEPISLVRVSDKLYWVKGLYTREPPKGTVKVRPTKLPGVYTDGLRIYLDKDVYKDPIENPQDYILCVLLECNDIIIKFMKNDYIRTYYGLEPLEYKELFIYLYKTPEFLKSLAKNKTEHEELIKFWNFVADIVKALENLIDFYKERGNNRFENFVTPLKEYATAMADDLHVKKIIRTLTTFEKHDLHVFLEEFYYFTNKRINLDDHSDLLFLESKYVNATFERDSPKSEFEYLTTLLVPLAFQRKEIDWTIIKNVASRTI